MSMNSIYQGHGNFGPGSRRQFVLALDYESRQGRQFLDLVQAPNFRGRIPGFGSHVLRGLSP